MIPLEPKSPNLMAKMEPIMDPVMDPFVKPVMDPTKQSQKGTWDELHAPIWKTFSYDYGHFLLHVPTSTVIEIDHDFAAYIRHTFEDQKLTSELEHSGEDSLDHSDEYAKALEDLAATLPTPPPRDTKVDIQAVSLNMAQGCNLRCTYCFAGEGDYGVKGMMSFETAIKAISTLTTGKSRFHIIFFGGEPLLNFSVIEKIVAWTKDQACKFSFSMTTNGTLLSDEKLRWLKEHKVAVTISYDGKGAHARNRLNKDLKSNSEALVNKKINIYSKQLSELDSFRLRATVTKDNLSITEQAILTTLNERSFRLGVSRHADNSNKHAFTLADAKELSAIMERIVESLLLAKEYDKLLRLESIMTFVRSIHHGKTSQMACGAGINYLTCSVDGDFYLCHRFNEDASEKYGDMSSGVNIAALQDVVAARNATKEPCKSCFAREWCAGGCFHEHKTVHGDKFILDETFCKIIGDSVQLAMRVYTHLSKFAPDLLESL